MPVSGPDLVAELRDLDREATRLRSHYYVGSRARRAADEITRLWRALEFYADEDNYDEPPSPVHPRPSDVEDDRGEKARTVLEPKP